MVCVAQKHRQRQICDGAHKGLHILQSIACVHKQRLLCACQKRHAHAHAVVNMPDAWHDLCSVKSTHAVFLFFHCYVI